ncbi:hypothetical protein FRC02_004099 [Tulasnella sp. 418]|nr:hypothetical protein FRC02_004099 [Tulasnella sp. 418]
MPQWVGKFDLVHVRAIQTGIHDFESFLYNIAHIMRPGALLILSTGGTQVFDENDNPRRDVEEGEEGFTWTKKFFSAIAAAVYKDKPDASKLWDKWANSNPNLEQVVRWEMPMPIGNWNLPTSEEQRYANEINRWNILELFMTCAPILVKEGFSEDVIERWKKEVKK